MPHKKKDLGIKGSALWYLVGLITSDGSLSKDGRHIDITSKDRNYLLGLKELTGLQNNVTAKSNPKNQAAYRIQFANRDFYDFLLNIGLMPRKSLILKEIKVKEHYFADFTRGMIDGDGCIRSWIHPTNCARQWSLRIYSGSEEFLKWFSNKIELYFGARGKIYKESSREGTKFILKYGKMAAESVLKNCYYDGAFAMERKARLALSCINSDKGWKRSKTIVDTGRVAEWSTRRT